MSTTSTRTKRVVRRRRSRALARARRRIRRSVGARDARLDPRRLRQLRRGTSRARAEPRRAPRQWRPRDRRLGLDCRPLSSLRIVGADRAGGVDGSRAARPRGEACRPESGAARPALPRRLSARLWRLPRGRATVRSRTCACTRGTSSPPGRGRAARRRDVPIRAGGRLAGSQACRAAYAEADAIGKGND